MFVSGLTPTFLLVILSIWTVQMAIPTFRMEGVSPENMKWVIGTRIFLVAFAAVLIFLIYFAWKGRPLPEIELEDGKDLPG